MSGDGRAACIDWLLTRRGEPTGCDPLAPDEWLQAHGLAAVSVADPADFEITGPFLARYAAGWTVMFGVTAAVVHDPLGAAEGPVLGAQVLTSLELEGGRWLPRGGPASGVVEALGVAAGAGEPMLALESARARAGAGLDGDRYAVGVGTFSARGGGGRDLTLIESEAIDELRAAGHELEPLEARRNVVVRGIDLDALIGERFRVGAVLCAGRRRCEPCARLQELTGPGVLRGLVHRGGLRADVLEGGEMRVGDEIAAVGGLSGGRT